MAVGVDAVSAAGAIAASGVAIAVLGCGFGNIYPRDHKDLMVEIARRGLVITEYLPGDEPASSNFPQRNRIIAALSKGTVVVEAGAKSGALITADYAKRLGRPVFVYPQNADEPNAAGTNFLAKNGAALITASNDVLEAMGLAELEQGIPFEIVPGADQMIKRLRIASRPYKSPTNSSAAVLPDRVTLRRIKAHLAEEEDLTATPAAWDEGFDTDLQNAPPLTEEDMEKIVADIEQMIDADAARLYLRIPPTAEGIQADFLKAVTDDPQKTSELLTSLELFGFVERLSGGFYRRNLIF
jgi:predicted Rossmann fold nucleotide-binding protein DprA/Smf involved in DNA uptake